MKRRAAPIGPAGQGEIVSALQLSAGACAPGADKAHPTDREAPPDPARARAHAATASGDRVVVCQWMVDELGLSGFRLIVYALIYQAGPHGIAISQSEAAYRCGMSIKSIRRILAELSGAGLIEQLARATDTGLPAVWRASRASAGSHWTIR